jgi:pyruvate/2-oxoacid:ferredoxin oxidoreductase alpha subunit
MIRPFPEAELRQALRKAARVGFLDRDISLGLGGILWAEGRSAAPKDSLVQNYILGLGGGDVRPGQIQDVLKDLVERQQASEPRILEVAT